MTQKEIAAALAAAVLLAGAIAFTAKEDPPPSDVKQLSVELAKGTVPPATVYKVERSDGGSVYASKYAKPGTGEVVIYLDESPCAWRPVGAKDCKRVDGTDPGDENTMQAGDWVGADCVRKACVIVAGEKDAP